MRLRPTTNLIAATANLIAAPAKLTAATTNLIAAAANLIAAAAKLTAATTNLTAATVTDAVSLPPIISHHATHESTGAVCNTKRTTCRYWNMDQLPTTNDPTVQAVEWIKLAEAIHTNSDPVPRRSPRKTPIKDYSHSGVGEGISPRMKKAKLDVDA